MPRRSLPSACIGWQPVRASAVGMGVLCFQNLRSACMCSVLHSRACLSVQVLKTYQSDRPINSADISPIFDHIVLGGGQEASQVRPKRLQSARCRAECRSIQGMRRHGACPAAKQKAVQHDG